MRFNCKVALSVLMLATVFTLVSFWTRCTDVTRQDNNFYRERSSVTEVGGGGGVGVGALMGGDDAPVVAKGAHLNLNGLAVDQGDPVSYRDIDCVINGEYTVSCRREGSEVYVPFSFLSKYFEVYGKISEYDGYDRFEWKHSYSQVYTPQSRYTPEGIFMSFEHYNVEVRDRVKCISGIEGVPISTQWGPQGYFYPIQIAQYGLSHYSKYLATKPPSRIILEDGEDEVTSRWILPDDETNIDNVIDPIRGTRVIEFNTRDSSMNPGVGLRIDSSNSFFLSFDFKFVTNGSITVVIEPKGKGAPLYYLHYVCSQTLLEVSGYDIYYGIGDRHRWTHITRDIHIDFLKGYMLKSNKPKKNKKLILNRVISVNFRGRGWVDNVTLCSSAHLPQFYYAANWLVLNQDSRGGWPIQVTRKLANGVLQLPPGWYSAMAQGQAMSLLVRAYVRTKNKKYLNAALKATAIFDVLSTEGGIQARFMDKHPWYEEYPTTPSCFVLNGFIYSLIGLYDLKTIAPADTPQGRHAEQLYTAGVESLRALLPLFDTGSGSIYDLRHVTLGVAPNLARWDYHATHINQLLLLSTVEDDPIFEETAKRWVGYMKGKRAPHN